MISILLTAMLLVLATLTLPAPSKLLIWRPSVLVALFSLLSLITGESLYGLSQLSELTLFLFVGAGFCFYLGDLSSLALNGRRAADRRGEGSAVLLVIDSRMKMALLASGFIGFLITVYLLVTRGLLSGDAIGYALRYAHMYGEESDYGAFHFLVAAQALGYFFILSNNRLRRRVGWILVLACLLGSIVKMERTSVLMLLSSVAFLVHYRTRNTKLLLYPILLSVFLFFLIAQLTFKADTVVGNFFLVYLGYGIKAFDEYIVKLPGVDGGSNVFLLIYKLLGRGRGAESINIEAGEFNVFSYIQAPYMDFGVMGVVLITYLFGLIWGMVFNCIRFSAFAVLMYASMIYPAIVVFYAWQFSLTTYIYLFIVYLAIFGFNSRVPVALRSRAAV